jgi:hypothetical protein
LSDGSQNESCSSEQLGLDSEDEKDEVMYYGVNEQSKDESSLSLIHDLLEGNPDKQKKPAQEPFPTQLATQKQGPIKGRRISDSIPKVKIPNSETSASKPQERQALTEESKKQQQAAQGSARIDDSDTQNIAQFHASEDQPPEQEPPKHRVESKLKRVNSKESVGSKKSNTSKRSKANSKRGSACGAHRMTLLCDVIKPLQTNNVHSLHLTDRDRLPKTSDNTNSMPQMLTNMISQTVCNSSSLIQKTEQLLNKANQNQLLSERRSPQKALKQNLILAPETYSKAAQVNHQEALVLKSSTSKTRGTNLNFAKVFQNSAVQSEQQATMATSQVDSVSNEPQQSLNSTLIKTKISSADKKTWLNPKGKTTAELRKPSSIFESMLLNSDRKEASPPREENPHDSHASQLHQSSVAETKQLSIINSLIQGLKNKPNRLKGDALQKKSEKEEKDGKPRPKKKDGTQKLSALAFHLQSAVEN